jgi:type III restriction enzyme
VGVANYKGVTETTRILLNHWFHTDHRLPNGRPFVYFDAQKFAVETLIYLYEVAGVRRHKDLIEKYAGGNKDLRLLQYDDFARYCVKMATGSGKTKVMALAIAWQFFNAVAEARDDYAKTFLLIAPNVIVFERLKKDFANGKIFRADPIIPPELKIFWDFDCYSSNSSPMRLPMCLSLLPHNPCERRTSFRQGLCDLPTNSSTLSPPALTPTLPPPLTQIRWSP